MNTKQEIRSNLEADLEAFFASGHAVTIVKTKRIRVRNSVKMREKNVFTGKIPSKHVTGNFDLISRGDRKFLKKLEKLEDARIAAIRAANAEKTAK